jgi:hypothetical protein
MRSLLIFLCFCAAASTPAGLVWAGCTHGYAPSAPYVSHHKVVKTVVVDDHVDVPFIAQQIIIQEQLAPAFVFQAVSAYQVPQQTAYTGQMGGYQGGQMFQQTGYQQATQASYQQASYQQTAQRPARLSDEDVKRIALEVKVALGVEPPTIGSDDVPPVSKPEQQTPVQSTAVNYLRTACASCHSGAVARGQVTLFDAAGAFSPLRRGQPMTARDALAPVHAGAMPPPTSGKPRPDQQTLNELAAMARN